MLSFHVESALKVRFPRTAFHAVLWIFSSLQPRNIARMAFLTPGDTVDSTCILDAVEIMGFRSS